RLVRVSGVHGAGNEIPGDILTRAMPGEHCEGWKPHLVDRNVNVRTIVRGVAEEMYGPDDTNDPAGRRLLFHSHPAAERIRLEPCGQAAVHDRDWLCIECIGPVE